MTENFLRGSIHTYSTGSRLDKKLISNHQNIYKNQQTNTQKDFIFYTCHYCVCDDATNLFVSLSRLTLTPQHLNSLQCLDQSFSNMNSALNSWTPSKVQNLSSPEDALVLFPKNSKILSHKRCLDYTSKHSRWLIWFYKPKPNMKVHKRNFSNMPPKSHIFFTKMMCFYAWAKFDLNLQREWFQELIPQSLTKMELITYLKSNLDNMWSWNTRQYKWKMHLVKIMSQQIFASNSWLERFKPRIIRNPKKHAKIYKKNISQK